MKEKRTNLYMIEQKKKKTIFIYDGIWTSRDQSGKDSGIVAEGTKAKFKSMNNSYK